MVRIIMFLSIVGSPVLGKHQSGVLYFGNQL